MHVYVKISFHVKCMYFLCKIRFLSYVNSKEIKSLKKKKMFRNILQVRLPAGKSVNMEVLTLSLFAGLFWVSFLRSRFYSLGKAVTSP